MFHKVYITYTRVVIFIGNSFKIWKIKFHKFLKCEVPDIVFPIFNWVIELSATPSPQKIIKYLMMISTFSSIIGA